MSKTVQKRLFELHKRFKFYALEHDTDMTTILIEYIESLVGKSEDADK